jgi:hypothetical protein
MSLAVRVLTVFPALVESALSEGMARIARERGVLDLATVNIRDFTEDRHRTTDDTPFGGGAGMVMMVEPVVKAWRSLPTETRGKAYVMSAKGMLFTQELAEDWSRAGAMTLVCGRYKGVDERVVDMLGAEEVSLGDFVLIGCGRQPSGCDPGVSGLHPAGGFRRAPSSRGAALGSSREHRGMAPEAAAGDDMETAARPSREGGAERQGPGIPEAVPGIPRRTEPNRGLR